MSFVAAADGRGPKCCDGSVVFFCVSLVSLFWRQTVRKTPWNLQNWSISQLGVLRALILLHVVTRFVSFLSFFTAHHLLSEPARCCCCCTHSFISALLDNNKIRLCDSLQCRARAPDRKRNGSSHAFAIQFGFPPPTKKKRWVNLSPFVPLFGRNLRKNCLWWVKSYRGARA